MQPPTQILPKNQKITFVGTLKSEPKISDKYQVLTFADSKIYASLYPGFVAGDKLKISGKINDSGAMFYPQVEKVGEAKSAFGFLVDLRRKIFLNFSKLLPEKEAVLLQGTVLGVDSIPKDFKDQLINTGTIHVVVVSGQNLSIAAGVFMAFAKYVGRKKALFMASGAVILYGALAGFSAPVMRAVVMVLVSSIAVYFGREVWPVWSLILAAIVIVFIDPTAISQVSFQLTFAASLGIMTAGKFLAGIYNFKFTILNLLWQNAAVALSAYLFTLPIIFFNFGRVSFVAPLVNVLVVEAVAPIMFLGFLVSFAGLLFMPLAQILAYFAFIPAFYFVKVVEIFANL